MEPPIACTLNDAGLRERRATILNSIRETALSVTPLPRGYAWRFRSSSETLAQLARLIELEERCCRFLSFRLAAGPGERSVCLEITGPPEAGALIADLFGC
jgi:hypothetical protein